MNCKTGAFLFLMLKSSGLEKCRSGTLRLPTWIKGIGVGEMVAKKVAVIESIAVGFATGTLMGVGVNINCID